MLKNLFLCLAFICSFAVSNVSEAQITSLPPSMKEEELFLVVQKAFDDGFYDVAIRYSQQFLDQYRDSDKTVRVKLLLGQSYFFRSQYLKAFDVFQSLLNVSEYKDATLFWLAETYLKGADYTQAEKYYRQVVDVYPDSVYAPQAYYSLGWTFYEKKNYEQAWSFFDQLVKKFPAHSLTEDAYFRMGESLYFIQDYKEAERYFSLYVRTFPESVRLGQAYFYIAESFYYRNEFAEAEEYYQKSISSTHDSHLILTAKINVGWCALKQKDFERAQRMFEEARVFASQKSIPSEDLALAMANLYEEKGDLQKAMEQYEAMISQYPSGLRLAQALLGKANTLYALKDYPRAVETYNAAIEKFSQDTEYTEFTEKFYFGLAWTHLKMGNIDQAIRLFENILNQSQSRVVKISALTQIGDAYQEQGSCDKAIKIYDQILKEFPNSIYQDYVQYRQGVCLLRIDNFEGALITFQSILANFPQSQYIDEIKYYTGVLYFRKENWEAAKTQMEEVNRMLAASHEFAPQANYLLALSYFNLKDYSSALTVFEKIIREYPAEESLVRNAESGLAKTYYSMGKVPEAIKQFTDIVAKYESSDDAFDALLWLGQHAYNTLKLEDAKKYYKQIIDRSPDKERKAEAYFLTGQAFEAQGVYEQALNQYQLVTSEDSSQYYAKAQLAIGEIFAREMDPKKALETYENIIRVNSSFQRDAYVQIAKIHQQDRDYSKAIETFQNALTAANGLSKISNAEIQFFIADTYELMNNGAAAIDEYLKIPYLYPSEVVWSIKAYLRAARIFEDKKDWPSAKKIYGKVIEYKTDEAKIAQERLEEIEKVTALEK